MLRHLLLGFAFSLLALPASAQQPIALTPNTLRLAPGQASPPATLADMAFLVGHATPARRRRAGDPVGPATASAASSRKCGRPRSGG
jgi:hypothetical protein